MGLALALGVVALLSVSGCQMFGDNARPPSKIEQALYTIETNVVVEIINKTNVITLTNAVVELVTITNLQNQVETHTITNFVEVPVAVPIHVTNLVEQTVWTKNTNSAAVVEVARSIGGLSGIPGVGELAGIAVSGLLGIWGLLRARNKSKVAATLAQVIEVGREVMQRTPQGSEAADKWQNWMIAHQAETGVIKQVISLLPKAVDQPAAEQVARELLALIGENGGKPAAS